MLELLDCEASVKDKEIAPSLEPGFVLLKDEPDALPADFQPENRLIPPVPGSQPSPQPTMRPSKVDTLDKAASIE